MNIGFIGLGIMGKPMAKNLMKAGHELIVHDINPAAVEELVAAGAKSAANPAQTAESASVVITMLPNSPHVKEVVLGPNGFIQGAKKGSVLIDMSSIAPHASKEIAQVLTERGIDMLDAPVSGGEPKAIDGTIAIMVGGKHEVFDRYYDLLMCMGSSAIYVGDIGAGNTAKLCNQIVVAINIAAVSEAMILAKKAGVDPELVYKAIRGGLAGSTVMDAKVPMMLKRNFKPGFKLDLHIKDMSNVLATSREVGAPLFLSTQLMEMMRSIALDGCGSEDHSSIVKFYEKLANEDITYEK